MKIGIRIKFLALVVGLQLVSHNNLKGQDSIQVGITNEIGLLGYSGLLFVPSAEIINDRSISIGASLVPYSKSFLNISDDYQVGEHQYYLNIGYMSFAELTIRLVRPNNIGDIGDVFPGIGDRSYSAKFRLLKERDYLPTVSVGVSDLFIVASYLHTSYLVATKNFTIPNTNLKLTTSLGYGTKLEETLGNYLQGGFGGVAVNWKYLTVMAEYDTEDINLGLHANFNEWLFLQVGLLNFADFGANFYFKFKI